DRYLSAVQRSRRRVLRSRHVARVDGTKRGGEALLRARSRRGPEERLRVAGEETARPDESMKTLFCCALVLAAAGCASSKKNDDVVDMVPPAQTIAQAQSAAAESRIEALQTSMTELLERLDVMNARITKLEAGSGAPAPPPAQVVPQATAQPAATAQPTPSPAL